MATNNSEALTKGILSFSIIPRLSYPLKLLIPVPGQGYLVRQHKCGCAHLEWRTRIPALPVHKKREMIFLADISHLPVSKEESMLVISTLGGVLRLVDLECVL